MRTDYLYTAILVACSACVVESESELFEWRPSHDGTPAEETSLEFINPRLLARFRPLPTAFRKSGGDMRQPVIDLGKRLFEEKRLSLDGTVACSSCHDLSRGGSDGERTSLGVGGKRGGRNSPTVLNAAGEFRQFWDGRAATIEEQAGGPILNPVEMAMPNREAVERVLRADPSYQQAFASAFPGSTQPITFETATTAIAAFERTLSTRGRWDHFLEGDEGALTREERHGLKVFLDVGCMVCHTGALLGGSTFERVGVVEPWPNQADQGRFEVTKQDVDRMVFKVPTLRNVLATGPYFHDGSSPTIEEAIHKMGQHQLGIQLSDEEVTSIATWFGALGGDVASETDPSDAPAAPNTDIKQQTTTRSSSVLSVMRGVAGPALDSQNSARVRVAFQRIAGLAPPGFPRWGSFARAGLAAAEAEDLPAARAACASCHNAYQESYRAKFRAP